MKYIKKIFWAMLAFIIILQSNVFVTMWFHPIGGAEYHEIFAYYSGGRLDVALRVYAEYVISACVLTVLLIFFRYPLSWLSLSIIALVIAWLRWRSICYFGHQTAEFHRLCKLLLHTIFPFVLLSGFIARWLSDKFFRWKRERNL